MGLFVLGSAPPKLTGLVPYTGATADVDLGIFSLTSDIVHTNSIKLVGGANIVFDVPNSIFNDTAQVKSINFSTRELFEGAGNNYPVIDWGNYALVNVNLYNGGGLLTWDGSGVLIRDNGGTIAFQASDRTLRDTAGITVLDFSGMYLADVFGNQSLNWANRTLLDVSSQTSVDYSNRDLVDSNFGASVDWQDRFLTDSVGAVSVNWQGRELKNGGGSTVLTYSSDLEVSDSVNFVFSDVVGTKIGSQTDQKLSFWGATPVDQPATSVASATRVGVAGTTVTINDTFDGYTIAKVVRALRHTGLLA